MDKKKVLHKTRICVLISSILCLLAAAVLLLKFVSDSTKKPLSAGNHMPTDVVQRVLFISSYNPLYFMYDFQVSGLEKSLYPLGIEYDVVFMDAKTYNSEQDELDFYTFLKARLKKRNTYKAVLIGDDEALLFALKYQEELFYHLPIVFFSINNIALAKRAAENPYITGFYENNFIQETLSLATSLFPSRKKIVALHDQSATGSMDVQMFFDQQDFYPEHAFIDLDASLFSQDELITLLEALPKDSMLIYMTCYSDKFSNMYSIISRTNMVEKHVHVPVFRNYVGAEGQGVLGGVCLDVEEQCRLAGTLAAQILSGKASSTALLNEAMPSHTYFDYKLVKAYGIDKALLPKDAVMYNKPDTIVSRYGKALPITAFIVASLLLLLYSVHLSAQIMSIANAELRASHDSLAWSQEELRYQAEHDEVLDIMNRRTALEFLRTNLTKEQTYAILMIDLDGFKELNESYGHQVADSILQFLTAMFRSMGEENNWMIARYGGDEFLLMIPNEQLTPTSATTEKILDTIRTPIPLGDETISITASLGISNSDGVTETDQHVINAEIATYEAKKRGRNGAFLYGDEMKEKMREENRIKIKLQEAFDNDGFYMLYQPQINSHTKLISGYEALVRMKEPGIYPGKFIPVAERSGWIWRIGRITTELVIKQLAQWRKEGKDVHPVSVNYSSNQLNDHGYIHFLEELLKKYDVPPHLLEIEITEGLFLEKSALADQIFKRFKEMGIKLLMDDFGTGYSSLGYLTYIPVDVIKLDKSLVDTYLVDGKDSFIRNIIHLMHDLGKEMIIEGVEEEWQFKRLQEFGADTIQGYYFSKPIPADEAIDFSV